MSEPHHTILVVDDNPWNRDLICRRLKRRGHRVLEAEDGNEALAQLAAHDVDLMILDVMMPGMSGLEVLQRVRRDRSPAELPIIMATARNESEDVVEALSHGANDYVTKPLDFPVVQARIEAQLRTRRAAREERAEEPGSVRTIRPGVILDRKYRLEEKLGSGNFGQVYRAHHLSLDQPVAVKLLHTALEDPAPALARFQREGRSAFRLRHPNAVTVLDFAVTGEGLAYLVMELLEGHSLDRELKREGRLSPERCAAVLLPVCEVLDQAHALGIIHRDVKPANIFLHRTHGGEVVKVLDFGIAKLVGDEVVGQGLTIDGLILGTPAYMAPERLGGEGYDGRADVYSLGVVLYQMLAGRLPFRATNSEAMALAVKHLSEEPPPIAAFRSDLPPALEAVVAAAMIKDYRQRPTAAELGRRLAAALDLTLPPALATAGRPAAADLFAFPHLLEPPV
ncbi:MAG: response regulator [Acidobacteria bacterium]|nr:MAG: response regulator [Acidobacteriota bacterium]